MNAKVPIYLYNNIQNNFWGWVVFAQTASGMVGKEMKCEYCKGPKMDPWNIAFDDILKEEVPPGVGIVRYANNTPVVMAEDNVPILEWKVNTTLEAMNHWFEWVGLSRATTKMETVLFTCRCRFSLSSFCLKGEQIRLCTAHKY